MSENKLDSNYIDNAYSEEKDGVEMMEEEDQRINQAIEDIHHEIQDKEKQADYEATFDQKEIAKEKPIGEDPIEVEESKEVETAKSEEDERIEDVVENIQAENEKKEIQADLENTFSKLDEENEPLVENEPEKPALENQATTILEGLLFIVGDDGISLEQASQVLGISESDTQNVFDVLQKEYSDDNHGIEIACYGGVYKFLSKAIVHPYGEKLFQTAKNASLSQAALETLAIIAYKQPITRVEIEEIRGVGADMMLRKLLARDLIKESGRSDAPGKPILYEVTNEFMDTFKLLSLDELPELPAFQTDEEDSGSVFEQ